MPRTPAKHKYERMADALVELIERRIGTYKEFFEVNGRPMFTTRISDEQLLTLWQDEGLRLKLQMAAMERGGNKEVEELETRVMKAEMVRPNLRQEIMNG